MEADTKQKLISLAEAASLSPYSQEYLSLRARQGKLRAVKRGNVWMTTQEWLEDYIRTYMADTKVSEANMADRAHIRGYRHAPTTQNVLAVFSTLAIFAVIAFSFTNPSFGAELKGSLAEVWNNIDKASLIVTVTTADTLGLMEKDSPSKSADTPLKSTGITGTSVVAWITDTITVHVSQLSKGASTGTASLYSVFNGLGNGITSRLGDTYIKYVGWGVPNYELAVQESIPLKPVVRKSAEEENQQPKIEIKELVRVTQIQPKEETTRIITQEKEVIPSSKLALTDTAINSLQSSVRLLDTRFSQLDSRLTTEEQKSGGTVVNNYLTGDYLSLSGGTIAGELQVMGNIIGERLVGGSDLYLTSTSGSVVMSAGSSAYITGKK